MLAAEYRNFIETGKYNLSPQIIPQFLEQLRTDIAIAQGQIKNARQILKIEKLPSLHKKAIKINADIEHFKDDIKKFRKRKAQLIKLREKPVLKKLNLTPSSKITITPLARPMIKDTGSGNKIETY